MSPASRVHRRQSPRAAREDGSDDCERPRLSRPRAQVALRDAMRAAREDRVLTDGSRAFLIIGLADIIVSAKQFDAEASSSREEFMLIDASVTPLAKL